MDKERIFKNFEDKFPGLISGIEDVESGCYEINLDGIKLNLENGDTVLYFPAKKKEPTPAKKKEPTIEDVLKIIEEDLRDDEDFFNELVRKMKSAGRL